jgi:hypothetical protein
MFYLIWKKNSKIEYRSEHLNKTDEFEEHKNQELPDQMKKLIDKVENLI